jgi:hypothetical protein
VIEAFQVAADTIEELAKGSTASQDILETHCKTFLERVKVCAPRVVPLKYPASRQHGQSAQGASSFRCLQAVQQTLVAVGPTNSSSKPYQARAYSTHIETSLLQQQIHLATEQLQAAQVLQAPNNQENTEAAQQSSG